MIKPALHKTTIKEKKWISSKVLEVTFEPVSGKFQFLAGHFVNLKIDDTSYRSYSIASDPANEKEFKLVAAVIHDGKGADFLKKVKIGDEVTIIGPSGRFLFSDENAQEIVFLATGTGIAPFISMLYQLQDTKSKAKIKLYWGLRNETEIFYEHLLDSFNETLDLNYQICLSEPSPNWTGCVGRIGNYYSIDDLRNAHIYLCGHPQMVEELLDEVIAKGAPKENIFHEKFTYAKTAIVPNKA